MRTFFLLLILSNLVFFAWSQGRIGNIDSGREPQRLAAQLNPGKLRILPAALDAAAGLACRQIGNLRPADAERLRSILAQQLPGAAADPLLPEEQAAWEISITGLASHAAADSKLEELKKLGIPDARIVEEGHNRFSLLLASYPSEAATREQLQTLLKKGVKSARVALRPPAERARLRVRGPEAALARLAELTHDFAEAELADCPAP